MHYLYRYEKAGQIQEVKLGVGSTFIKPSGTLYTILAITNLDRSNTDQPVSLVYRDKEGLTYCAPVERVLRDVEAIQPPPEDSFVLNKCNVLDSVPRAQYVLRDTQLVLKVLMLANQKATKSDFPLQCIFTTDAVKLYSMPYSQFVIHITSQESSDARPPHPPDPA